MDSDTCSTSSTLASEPIAGTAVEHTWRWLGIEYRGRWEARALAEARLPQGVRAWLSAFSAHPGTRVQLLKGPERSGPLTVFFADTTPGACRVHRFALASVDELVRLDIDALLAGDAPGRTDEPLLWVCTNGRRDVCCARYGVALYQALADRSDIAWKTDHLGGHRFAATLLSLPDGLCYGRLRDTDAESLLEAQRAGRIHSLDTLRGRTAWSRAAQVAESHLRGLVGDLTSGGVKLVTESDAEVTLAHAGRLHTIAVSREALPQPIIASCGRAAGPAFAMVAASISPSRGL